MKYYFYFIINVLFITIICSFNINRANDGDWLKLSDALGTDKSNNIKEYIYENGSVNNIYQLLDVEKININDIDIIRSIISIDNSINMAHHSKRSYNCYL